MCSSILAPELSNLLRIHKWVFVFYWAFYPQYRKDALPRSTERWKVVNGPHNMRRSQEPTRTVLLRPSTCTLLVQWKFQWKEPRQGLGTSLLYTTEPFELHEHIDTICSLTGRTALPPLSESTRPCSRRSACPPWASSSAKDPWGEPDSVTSSIWFTSSVLVGSLERPIDLCSGWLRAFWPVVPSLW